MNVQVDSNMAACLEIALMSPGNWRPWTRASWQGSISTQSSPWWRKQSQRSNAKTCTVCNGFHISNGDQLMRPGFKLLICFILLISEMIYHHPESSKITSDLISVWVRKTETTLCIYNIGDRGAEAKGAQRDILKTGNQGAAHTPELQRHREEVMTLMSPGSNVTW